MCSQPSTLASTHILIHIMDGWMDGHDFNSSAKPISHINLPIYHLEESAYVYTWKL